MIGRAAWLIFALAVVLGLLMLLPSLLPVSPFTEVVAEAVAFLHSETVGQGLAWLAWFFPIGNVVLWIPAFINAILGFTMARMTLVALQLL